MNYQQTKTIKKYSINKNLLLVGLLIFASFAQACGGSVKKGGNKPGNNVDNQALLTMLGKFDQMSSASLKTKVGQDAKECGCKDKVTLAEGDVQILKLPKEIKMEDEETKEKDD